MPATPREIRARYRDLMRNLVPQVITD